MTDIIKVIQELHDRQTRKIEELRKLIGQGITRETFDTYERENATACEQVVNEALQRDLINLFGKKENETHLNFILRQPKWKVHKKRKVPEIQQVCHFPGCGKTFVNAGNLMNHLYAHERESRQKSTANSSSVDADGNVVITNNNRRRSTKSNIPTSTSQATSFSATAVPLPLSINTATDLTSSGMSSNYDGYNIIDQNMQFNTNTIQQLEDNNSRVHFMEDKRRKGSAKRESYSIQEKMNIIERYDELKQQNVLKDVQLHVGQEFNISQSMVSKWIGQRKILAECLESQEAKGARKVGARIRKTVGSGGISSGSSETNNNNSNTSNINSNTTSSSTGNMISHNNSNQQQYSHSNMISNTSHQRNTSNTTNAYNQNVLLMSNNITNNMNTMNMFNAHSNMINTADYLNNLNISGLLSTSNTLMHSGSGLNTMSGMSSMHMNNMMNSSVSNNNNSNMNNNSDVYHMNNNNTNSNTTLSSDSDEEDVDEGEDEVENGEQNNIINRNPDVVISDSSSSSGLNGV